MLVLPCTNIKLCFCYNLHKAGKILASASEAALPDVRLKPDSYGFPSVKTSYDLNLGRTLKSYGFLVSNMELEI